MKTYTKMGKGSYYPLGEVPLSSDVNLHSMYVDEVQVAKSEGQPIVRTGTLFVPIDPIVNGMALMKTGLLQAMAICF